MQELKELQLAHKGRLAPLGPWIHQTTPKYSDPRHLAPLLELFHRIARKEVVEAIVHAPVRHGKTESILHGIPWLLLNDPRFTTAYISYGQGVARAKSRIARGIALQQGFKLSRAAATLGEWRVSEGGGMLATGIDGALTGWGANLVMLDDLFKNRAEAESQAHRDRVWDAVTNVAITRREPGASVILNMARWHPDDVAGRLVNDHGWQYICLPAISDAGAALWPQRYSVADLTKTRELVGEYTFSSLYQGQPIPRGGAVFTADPAIWRLPGSILQHPTELHLPRELTIGIGIDLAFTEKKKSDYSAAVILGTALVEGVRRFFVLDVIRAQVDAPNWEKRLAALVARYPGVRMRWHGAPSEKPIADLMRTNGLPVEYERAVGDKLVRALPVQAAWNARRVYVPGLPRDQVPWLEVFLSEVLNFTGVGDRRDDQVDALASGHQLLSNEGAGYTDQMRAWRSPRRRQ